MNSESSKRANLHQIPRTKCSVGAHNLKFQLGSAFSWLIRRNTVWLRLSGVARQTLIFKSH